MLQVREEAVEVRRSWCPAVYALQVNLEKETPVKILNSLPYNSVILLQQQITSRENV